MTPTSGRSECGPRSPVEWFGLEQRLHYGLRASEEMLPDRTRTQTNLSTGEESVPAELEYELTTLSAHLDDTVALSEDWTLVAGPACRIHPRCQG